jgi:hypothetical protein
MGRNRRGFAHIANFCTREGESQLGLPLWLGGFFFLGADTFFDSAIVLALAVFSMGVCLFALFFFLVGGVRKRLLLLTGPSSTSGSAIWHSLIELVSSPEVWLAQCLCESNESLPYRKLVESAKAEEQRIRIGTSQSASIDGENLDTLGRRQRFRLS